MRAEKPVVVIAEDDTDLRRVLAARLCRAGVKVIETGDGEATLAALETAAPDMLCLDLNLPLIGGFEVFRRLRRHPRLGALPVLVMTGRNTMDDVATATELGVVGYLEKPFSPRRFAERVLLLLKDMAIPT
jgi:DNA-binding response OmpR family regulator